MSVPAIALLGVDICVTMYFLVMRSRGFIVRPELGTDDGDDQLGLGDAEGEVKIPWRFKGHLVTALAYPVAWLLSVAGESL